MKQSLASRIRDARALKGLTQERIAKALGVSRAAVGQWERGLTAPSLKNLQALEKLFAQEVAFGLGPDNEETRHLKPVVWRMIAGHGIDRDKGWDVPVNMAVVGKYGRCIPIGNGRETIEYIQRPFCLKHEDGAYAIAIASKSMSPRFEIDETIYVVPDVEPVDGEYVVVHFKDGVEPGGVRLYHLSIRAPEHLMVEQYLPRQTYVLAMADVARVDRVVPWGELIERGTASARGGDEAGKG